MTRWHAPIADFRITNSYAPDHPAWDLCPPIGQPQFGAPVYAMRGGLVAFAWYDTRPELTAHPNYDRGIYVLIITDNGDSEYYCHLQRTLVASHTFIEPGTQIGEMGATGYTIPANAPHLHLRVQRAGEDIDWMPEYLASQTIGGTMRTPEQQEIIAFIKANVESRAEEIKADLASAQRAIGDALLALGNAEHSYANATSRLNTLDNEITEMQRRLEKEWPQ